MSESERDRTTWTKPTFVEIRMNAEVGSYQDELEERNRPPRTQGETTPGES